MNTPHFLLVGNGAYGNRGCEAIVRGTMAILRGEFGEQFRVTVGTYAHPELIAEQAANEYDPLIAHVSLLKPFSPRWSAAWWKRQMRRALFIEPPKYGMLDPFCRGAACALQIGGDNYTLDYGRPIQFMELDQHLQSNGTPIMLWGASVGPFELDEEFAPVILNHLRGLDAILVRESESYDYLDALGFGGKLHRMADPAFVMDPVEPPVARIGCPVLPDAIGLNFSPLMAKYITCGDVDAWIGRAAEIVRIVVETLHRDVLLIPHVTWSFSNDHAFLRAVASGCADVRGGKVYCVGDKLSAAETKWVISRCAALMAARTHATIAALSSCIPTISLAYSRKAMGLNQDLFGCQDYCIQPSDVSPAIVVKRISEVLARRESLKEQLAEKMPKIRESAMCGGTILRRLISSERGDMC